MIFQKGPIYLQSFHLKVQIIDAIEAFPAESYESKYFMAFKSRFWYLFDKILLWHFIPIDEVLFILTSDDKQGQQFEVTRL